MKLNGLISKFMAGSILILTTTYSTSGMQNRVNHYFTPRVPNQYQYQPSPWINRNIFQPRRG